MEKNNPKLGFINGKDEFNDSINYWSPEMLNESLLKKDEINEKVDVYAFGCLLFEMSQLEELFEGKNREDNKISTINFRLFKNNAKFKDFYLKFFLLLACDKFKGFFPNSLYVKETLEILTLLYVENTYCILQLLCRKLK